MDALTKNQCFTLPEVMARDNPTKTVRMTGKVQG